MPTVEVTDCQRGYFVNVKGENGNGDELEFPTDDKIGNVEYDIRRMIVMKIKKERK